MEETSISDIIKNIVEAVFYSHFSYVLDPDLKQDLMQEGFLVAYELVKSNTYDASKSLRNYIYTGVRNGMTNYMYHNKKEMHNNLDVVVENQVKSEEQYLYDIDLTIVYDICIQYEPLGDYYNTALKYLSSLGIIDYTNPRPEENINENIKEQVNVLVLWALIESEKNNE